jgi:adenosine/AMP kinase
VRYNLRLENFMASQKQGEIMLEIKAVTMEFPANANIIVGQSHFIKTVEDLYEAVSTTVPQAKFGLAFNESSGACLTRVDGNDPALREAAIRNAQALGCGHTFVLVIQDAYPINVLNAIRNVPEVCSIFCATANPVEIIVAQSEQGRGVMGVIDGSSPKGVEKEADVAWRHDLLRKIGYKR